VLLTMFNMLAEAKLLAGSGVQKTHSGDSRSTSWASASTIKSSMLAKQTLPTSEVRLHCLLLVPWCNPCAGKYEERSGEIGHAVGHLGFRWSVYEHTGRQTAFWRGPLHSTRLSLQRQ